MNEFSGQNATKGNVFALNSKSSIEKRVDITSVQTVLSQPARVNVIKAPFTLIPADPDKHALT